jgi:ribosome biogenesis protein NSA1
VSPSPNLLASVSLDRFARLHSSFPLPSQPGHRQEHRGEVLDKFFVHSIPTVIVWDGNPEVAGAKDGDPDGDVDEIWNNMENVGGDNDPQEHEGLEIRKKRRTR